MSTGNGERASVATAHSHPRPTGPSTRLPVLGERQRGTKFVELSVKSVINSPESTGMGFWSLNPYVGCEFGCTYCYARYAHRYVVERARDAGNIDERQFLDLGAPRGLESFEHRIFVKARTTVLRALERDLLRVRRRARHDGAQNIVIGTATDPYQPAERQYQITRAVLARLREERDFHVGIITKSPLICRDLDVLKDLARHHSVSVYISLVSVDVQVIKLFEARSPLPHARLRALHQLSDAGIRAGVIVAPILPGITDSTQQIHALVRAGRDAGARFISPVPLRLYPDVQRRFLPIVERHFPDLAKRYHAAYRNDWNAPEEYLQAVQQRFHRIARAHGIPETEEAEEQPTPRKEQADTQLSLFARMAQER